MLKLEKTSDSGLTILMREKDGFFEPRLVKALLIALLLHFIPLLLFHAAPFSFSSTFTFPPIQVQTETSVKGISVYATPYQEDELPPPPLSLIPPLDWISFSQASTLIPSLNYDAQAFEKLEERIWPKWQDLYPLQIEEPAIQLTISGDLAQHPLIETDPLLQQLQSFSSDTTPVYISYQVQLDQNTGEIFWYEREKSTGDQMAHQMTEKILKNLRFSVSNSSEVIKGALHFVLLNPFFSAEK